MLPYKSIIPLFRDTANPLYLQISNAFIKNISNGVIQPKHKLPGARTLSALLGVNRRTVSSAYEELEAQGWLEIKANRGCFVSSKLPINKTQGF